MHSYERNNNDYTPFVVGLSAFRLFLFSSCFHALIARFIYHNIIFFAFRLKFIFFPFVRSFRPTLGLVVFVSFQDLVSRHNVVRFVSVSAFCS